MDKRCENHHLHGIARKHIFFNVFHGLMEILFTKAGVETLSSRPSSPDRLTLCSYGFTITQAALKFKRASAALADKHLLPRCLHARSDSICRLDCQKPTVHRKPSTKYPACQWCLSGLTGFQAWLNIAHTVVAKITH